MEGSSVLTNYGLNITSSGVFLVKCRASHGLNIVATRCVSSRHATSSQNVSRRAPYPLDIMSITCTSPVEVQLQLHQLPVDFRRLGRVVLTMWAWLRKSSVFNLTVVISQSGLIPRRPQRAKNRWLVPPRRHASALWAPLMGLLRDS